MSDKTRDAISPEVEPQIFAVGEAVSRLAEKLDSRPLIAEGKDEHSKQHLPFRSWCAQCVGGAGKDPDRGSAISPACPTSTWTSCSWGARELERNWCW